MGLIWTPKLVKPPLGTPLNKSDPINSNILGSWLMNEKSGSTVRDSSGNKLNGTLAGTTNWVGGKYGPCIDFPDAGGDYISLGYDFPNPPFSFFCWIKFDSTTVDNIAYFDFANGSYATIGIIDYRLGTHRANISSAPLVATNTWYMLGFTSTNGSGSGDVTKIYLNGVDVTGTNSEYWSSRAIESRIGERTAGYGINGQISHAYAYRRIFSPSEIQRLYRTPFCGYGRSVIELFSVSSGGTNETVTPSALALTGSVNAPALNYDFSHTVSALSLSGSIPGPSVLFDYVHAVSAALAGTLAIENPTINFDFTVNPDALALTLTLNDPTVNYDFTVTPNALSLTISTQEPTLNYDMAVAVSAVTLLSVLNDPLISTGTSITVEPSAQSLTLTVNAPPVNYDMTVLAEAIAATLAQPQVIINYDYVYAVSAALNLISVLNDPLVSAGISVTVQPSAQGLTLSFNEPSYAYDMTTLVNALQMTAALNGINVEYDYAFDVSAIGMNLTLNDPSILTGAISAAAVFMMLKKHR